MRKTKFVNNNFYHIYNRGVDKRNIFLENFDYSRFLQGLEELNDEKPIISLYSKSFQKKKTENLIARKPLVKALYHCLMPNHFHLVLEQLIEDGISKFMHKISTSHTKYFNEKYDRNGRLFEGSFKALFINKDNYLNHLLIYVHLNPLKLIESDWEESGIKDIKRAQNFIENYRWSSFKNLNPDNQKRLRDWLNDISLVKKFRKTHEVT